MTVLIFLIPITLGLSLLGLCCFLWSIKSKQYEDLKGAANRILFEDEESDVKRDLKKLPEEKEGSRESPKESSKT